MTKNKLVSARVDFDPVAFVDAVQETGLENIA
jgi:hypothetical protein